MAIKIRKDGVVQDLVINANEVRVLDKDGNFRSKNLETVLKELNMNGGSGGGTGTGGSGYPKDAEYVYVKDTEPDMDGVWFDESDVSSQPIVGDNSVVKAIREYIDTDVKAIVDKNDKIVQDIKENVGDKLDVVGQLSNENLLANGDFQIWSLGTSFGTGLSQTFSADKWNIARNEQTTSKTDKGVKVVVENASSEGGGIIQTLKLDNKYIGQPITLSASIKNTNTMVFGVRSKDYTKNFAFTNLPPSNDFRIVSVSGTLNNFVEDVINIELSNATNQNNTFEVEWVKLEFGEVATPFVPKTYSEELLACNDGVIASNPNLLINGDFRVWQRGTSFDSDVVSLQKKYVADRWQVDLQTGSYILRQSNDSILISPKSPGWHCNIRQILEENDILKLQGQTVTFSVNISFANAKNLSIVIKDDKEEFKRIQCKNGLNILTCTLPNSRRIVNLKCSIDFYTIEQTVSDLYIANAKLELGSVATPFIPRPYAEELALCQRYYECSTHVMRGLIGAELVRLNFDVQYKQTKRIPPTLKIYGLNNEEGVVVGKIGSSINFPVRIYQCTTNGFGCIDVVDKKGQNFVPAETFELAGWTSDAEIY